MEDYTKYLLRTSKDIAEFKAQYSAKLYKLMNRTCAYLDSIPIGPWVDYRKRVKPEDIPMIIGCICLWIDRYSRVGDSVEFCDNTAHLIRRRQHDFPN